MCAIALIIILLHVNSVLQKSEIPGGIKLLNTMMLSYVKISFLLEIFLCPFMIRGARGLTARNLGHFILTGGSPVKGYNQYNRPCPPVCNQVQYFKEVTNGQFSF